MQLKGLAVLAALAISALLAVGAESERRTEIIVVGGLHGMHKQNPKYSPEILRNVIVNAKPAAILSELPATVLGKPTIVNGRIDARFASDASDENWSANAAADVLNVPVIAYDRADRNEHFATVKYFERMEALSKQIRSWLRDERNRQTSPAEAAIAGSLSHRAQESQDYFSLCAGPEIINSKGFDDLVRLKHEMSDELMPRLAARERFARGDGRRVRISPGSVGRSQPDNG